MSDVMFCRVFWEGHDNLPGCGYRSNGGPLKYPGQEGSVKKR